MVRMLLASALLLIAGAAPAQQPASAVDGLRPRIHFSPERNWTNDPNGLVYFQGEYHLFFQYAPGSMTWHRISWGHAVSTDLLHWKELPLAIAAHDDEMIYTGSVVVDDHNTSGLCLHNRPCLVAIYTGNYGSGQTQHEVQELAVSQDRGRTWTPYSGNPVLDLHMADFRDPGVFWNQETKRWVMVVALPNEHVVNVYSSPDLKAWTKMSTFGPAGATGGQWECPNLVKVTDPVHHSSLWALKVGINPGGLQGGSGEQYFLGTFDGTRFTQSTEPGSHGWSDYGKDSYCALSYNNIPAGHAPTLLGWMSNWQYADKLPTTPWRGQMTIPRTLTLLHDQEGIALAQMPVVAPIRFGAPQAVSLSAEGDAGGKSFVAGRSPLEMTLTFVPSDATVFGVRFYSDATHWTELGFDLPGQRMWMDRTHSGLEVTKDFASRTEAPLSLHRPLDVHLVLDSMSVEAFAQNGSIAMTNLVLPLSQSVTLQAFVHHGKAVNITGQAWRLKPAVPKQYGLSANSSVSTKQSAQH